MKTSTIRIVGKHITVNDDELEEGYIEIEVEAYDILREINSEDVTDYARWSLNMKYEDDFESSLDDFSEYDLVRELKDRSFDFMEEVEDQDMIHYLESNGCKVIDEDSTDSDYDYVDDTMFEEIREKFLSANWTERVEIYNKIMKL